MLVDNGVGQSLWVNSTFSCVNWVLARKWWVLAYVVTEVSRGGGMKWWRQEVGLQISWKRILKGRRAIIDRSPFALRETGPTMQRNGVEWFSIKLAHACSASPGIEVRIGVAVWNSWRDRLTATNLSAAKWRSVIALLPQLSIVCAGLSVSLSVSLSLSLSLCVRVFC